MYFELFGISSGCGGRFSPVEKTAGDSSRAKVEEDGHPVSFHC